MSAGDPGPQEVSPSLVDPSNAPEPGILSEPSNGVSWSLRQVSEVLDFLKGVLGNEDQARRLGSLIVRIGIAGALTVVPIATVGYLLLGSMAGNFTVGFGTGSAIAIMICVHERKRRRRKR
jgi:hypothetical protein